MILRFEYLEEPLRTAPPPSLEPQAIARWRPLVPLRIIGPHGRYREFNRAVLDPGSDDCVFPLDAAALVGVSFLPYQGHMLRWRGQRYSLRFGQVDLELADEAAAFRWPAVVGFSPAPVRYPLLGNAGCLAFFDVTFLGDPRIVELEANTSFPGTIT